ncbi:MAG: anthranilate synthase component II [Opitutales bacterium]
MLLVIDNFDSFTYNLVQYFGDLGVEQKVVRNNEITPEEAWELNPERILISPGPCTPTEAGVSLAMIEKFAGKRPILGVCLGHQSIGHHFGGNVIRTPELMHGKTSSILHEGKGLFSGLPSPLTATRYHSLIIERETIPDCLEITAETEDGIIMAVQHKEFQVHGVQFHPESYATENGMKMLQNFLNQ